MENELDKTIANWKEINTGRAKSELPLVFFTLLTQMAAGIAVAALFSGPLSMSLLIVIGGLIIAAGLIAFLHLGTPSNAWRAVLHLKKSWLSRELLMFGLFGVSWLLCLFLPEMGQLPLAIFGVGLIYSMAQVYRLRSISAWDTYRTLLAFVFSVMLLGSSVVQILDTVESTDPGSWYPFVSGGVLAGVLWLTLAERGSVHQMANRLRLGLIVLGLVGAVVTLFASNTASVWLVNSVFLIILSEEIIGRWLFYQHLHQRRL
jgi:DMSO reductase anchor subunit